MSSNIELRNINGKQLIYVEGDPFLILSFQLIVIPAMMQAQ